MTLAAKQDHIARIEASLVSAQAWLESARRQGNGYDQRRYADLVEQHERELAEAQRIKVDKNE